MALWSVEEPLKVAGYRLADFDRILDFGCGVGRMLQAINLTRREGQELWGCDVNEACARWCRENLDFATVAHTSLDPPLPYADESFDLVIAISVFTHLSRPRQVATARELIRVLRPGGVAFITTCGLGMLPDVLAINDAWTVREFDLLGATGSFLHFAEGEEEALEGQRAVIVLHAPDAVARIFSPLRLAHRAEISAVAAGQDVSVLVKREGGCRVLLPIGAIEPRRGVPSTVQANKRVSDVVTLDFAGAEDERVVFRSYVSFDERRYELVHLAVDCRVRDAATGRLLAVGRFAFPSTVSLGPGHFIPFSIETPGAPAMRVELALALLRAPWQPDAIRFRWWDSRLEAMGHSDDVIEQRAPIAPSEMTRRDLVDL
ncbi:MAG: class I SAM-dependent methyltransferase [Casimicrobiaceae bacterium]